MKIWHITTEVATPELLTGGMGVHVFNLARAQVELGHEVTVFCPLKLPTTIDGVKYEPWERRYVVGTNELVNQLVAMRATTRKLLQLWKADPPDIIHGHEWDCAELWSLFKSLGVPTTATMHISNVINSAYLIPEYTEEEAFFLWWELNMGRHADGMIAISEHMEGYLRYLGTPCPIRVIHNGVKVEDFDGEKVPRPSDKILAFWHGRFCEQKGLGLIAEAAKRANDILFVLAGDYDLVHTRSQTPMKVCFELQKLAKEGRVLLTGKLSQKEIGGWLKACDVAVYPHHNAPFDCSILEAMACEAPIITTGVDAIKEYAKADEDAVFISPTADDILSSIRLLMGNEQERQRLSANARKTASEFTWKKCAVSSLDFYSLIIEGNDYAKSLRQAS